MYLFLYDLFVWFNFVAFCVAIADKLMEGALSNWFYITLFAFGGCGSAIACFLIRHRTRSGGAALALIVGVVQLIAVKFLLNHFFA